MNNCSSETALLQLDSQSAIGTSPSLLQWRHQHLAQTNSTMEQAGKLRPDQGDCWLITTDSQSQGRGQRDNKWEDEAGKNLLFSFVFCPHQLLAAQQFLLSQVTALSLWQTLLGLCPGFTIKWPNDLYFQERKVAGMLLEHAVQGNLIQRTVVGIGLNVNQRHFYSDAPNPISLYQIVGHELSRQHLLESFIAHFNHYYALLCASETEILRTQYWDALFRNTGWHAYTDLQTGAHFFAKLLAVMPHGGLVLQTTEGQQRTYAFKEVAFDLK